MSRMLATTVLLILVVLSSFSQTIRRVPQDYPSIQAAITAAVNGDTVLVAEGTYQVNLGISKKIVLGSLYIMDGDTSHISRTILDGGAPLNPAYGSTITLAQGTDTTTTICGFTITKGSGTVLYWLGQSNYRYGGGILLTDFAGGRIKKNIIKSNTVSVSPGWFGGAAGICVWMSDYTSSTNYVIIEENIIENNRVSTTATSGITEGGGIAAWQINCRIVKNIIRNNTVQWMNTSYPGAGGGILFASEAGGNETVIIADNVIAGNRSRRGGGMLIAGNGARARISGNTVTNNRGDLTGGGIELRSTLKQSDISGNFISRNSAAMYGGGIYAISIQAYSTFTNNIITHNTADSSGGGFRFYSVAYPYLVNNTVAFNTSPVGSQMEVRGSSTGASYVKGLNLILWGNSSTAVSVGANSKLDVGYSLVKGGWTGEGNIDFDPLFVPGDSLCRLSDASPAIDGGRSSAIIGGHTLSVLPYDYSNNPRPTAAYTNPDMGASENHLPQPKVWRVPDDYAKIQQAIDAAKNGDIVLVSEGTYAENLVIGKKITLASLYHTDGDTAHISRTIIDGGTPPHPDSATVIRITLGTDSTTVVKGFTIQNGKGTLCIDPYDGHLWVNGAGVWIDAGAATITYNIIRKNTITTPLGATGAGISIWPTAGPVTYWVIDHNWIINNTATSTASSEIGSETAGASLSADGRFTNNIVDGNIASGSSYSWSGGVGVYGAWGFGSSNVVIANNIIRKNSAQNGGGIGMAVHPDKSVRPNCILINNIIYSNYSAAGQGAGVCVNSGNYVLINNTIAANLGGSALYLTNGRGGLTFRTMNNIVWNTSAAQEINDLANAFAGKYNCVRGGSSSEGNIVGNPLFLSTTSLDSLCWFNYSSPCKNAGADSASVSGMMLHAPSTDYYGHVRYSSSTGARIDIGAFEDGPWSDVEDLSGILPTAIALEQNFPNPFNPSTTIRFALPHESDVRLTVYNLLGQKIEELVNEQLAPGMKQVTWDAKVPTGVYLYRLDVEGSNGERYSETRRMTVLK